MCSLLLFCAALSWALAGGVDSAVHERATDSDVWATYWPQAEAQYRAVRSEGLLPLFEHDYGGGYVVAAAGHLAVSYPIRQLVLWMSPSARFAGNAYFLLHLQGAALTMWLLGRRLGLRMSAATLAGAAYVSAPLVLAWGPFFHSSSFFAWFPALLLGCVLTLRDRYLVGFLTIVGSTSMLVVGGSLQNALLAVLFSGTWFIVGLATQWDARRVACRIATGASGLIIGLLLAASAWLPFLIVQRASSRTALPTDRGIGSGPDVLLGLLDPNLSPSINALLALGLGVSALGVIGIIWPGGRDLLPARITLTIALLLLISPLAREVAALVPGWTLQSNYDRVSFVIVPLLALLAGQVWNRLASAQPLAVPAAAIAGSLFLLFESSRLLLLLAVPVLIALTSKSQRGQGHDGAPLLRISAVLALMVISIAAANPLRGLPSSDPDPEPRSRAFREMSSHPSEGLWSTLCMPLTKFGYMASANLQVGVPMFDIYESFVSRRFADYWSAMAESARNEVPLGGQWFQHTPEDGRLNGLLLRYAGVQNLIGSSDSCQSGAPSTFVQLESASEYRVFTSTDAFPPAWRAGAISQSSSMADSIEGILSQDEAASFENHVDYLEDPDLPARCAVTAAAVPVKRSTEGWTVQVETALARPGCYIVTRFPLLPTTQVLGPSGEIRAIPANGAFVAFNVTESGDYAVNYVPRWVSLLRLISFLTPVGILPMLLWSVRWSRIGPKCREARSASIPDRSP